MKKRMEGQNDNRMQEPISTKLNVCVFQKQKALKKYSNAFKVTNYMNQTGTSDGKLV